MRVRNFKTRLLMPLLFACVAAVGLFAGTAIYQIKTSAADSEPITQIIGPDDSAIVSTADESFIMKDLVYGLPDYPATGSNPMLAYNWYFPLVTFTFDNGTNHQEIRLIAKSFDNLFSPGFRWAFYVELFGDLAPYWYELHSTNTPFDISGNVAGLLYFNPTANGPVITIDPEGENIGLFSHVTITTCERSSVTIVSGGITFVEFTVTFKDIEGNIIAVVETADRFIPVELVPDAPLINKRPFQYWTNLQGYKVDEIITSNVVFFPIYGYDPYYIINDDDDGDGDIIDMSLDFWRDSAFIALVSVILVCLIAAIIIRSKIK